MKKEPRYRRFLLAIHNYLVFFALMAFVITCCMMLFVTVLSFSLDLTLTEEDLNVAAKLTFGNVLLLSLICTVFDRVRRKITVDRPVKQITQAAEKMMQGDFSVRIAPLNPAGSDGQFNEIIECINQMAEELSGIETLRSDFIANVSHELKTPLSVIKNYSSMLEQADITEEERQKYAKTVTEASGKLSELISNILKLNKLENQQITLSPQKYNLGEQLCECLLSFEAAWEKKELDIETDIEEDVFVKTDKDMMSLVFNNLFSNAIKFTDKGGSVSLTLRSAGDYAVVEVADSGCGISQEVGTHMFEKFYQGDTSHSTQGNGLGLTLVKRVIDITGSEIDVSSEVGKGSVFTVKIRRESHGTT